MGTDRFVWMTDIRYQAKRGDTLGIDILELLRLRGFDSNRRIKLVRHQDARYDVLELQRPGWLETYQAFQAPGVFDNVDCFICFVGVGGTRARLVGIYDVLGSKAGHEAVWPPGCPFPEEWKESHYYELRREPGFEDLENRVVIEWGPGGRAWHQWLRSKEVANKEVVEILPKGPVLPPFDDYLGFTLTHSELKDLCSQPEANTEWRSRLSAVAGVYLILATTTGAQYVGSAHGVEGFWGRWSAYARDGHGGNKLLSNLVEDDSAYPNAFSYSILQILPRTFARSEVLKWERLYKQKLGSRAVGLNAN